MLTGRPVEDAKGLVTMGEGLLEFVARFYTLDCRDAHWVADRNSGLDARAGVLQPQIDVEPVRASGPAHALLAVSVLPPEYPAPVGRPGSGCRAIGPRR